MSDKIYTIDEIRAIVAPVAKKYGVPALYLFGSYARGHARRESDIDLPADTRGTKLYTFFALGAFYAEPEAALGKPIDLVTGDAPEQDARLPSEKAFGEQVMRESVNIYAVA